MSQALSASSESWPWPPIIRASVGWHLLAIAAAVFVPGAAPWAIGAIVLNHVLITAAGLTPRQVIDQVWMPLRLDSGQLARFVLAPLSPDRHQLWVVMEHIISDAVSLGRVVDLVAEGYSRRVTGAAAVAPTP